MDLSIIIVNYDTNAFLGECLNSIIKHTSKLEYEIIVIDNNSTDRGIENFPKNYYQVKFHFLKTNKGFGSGCNSGVKFAKGKYYAFVNPDITIDSNIFYELFLFMEGNPDAGFSSGAFTNLSGDLTYSYNNFPGYFTELSEASGLGDDKLVDRLNKIMENASKSRKILEVDWIYGACMFIRAESFNKSEGFDETMFLYYEDVDLQHRIKKLGYKIILIPYLQIKHFINSSVRDKEKHGLSYFHYHRSKILYTYKYFNFFKRNIIRLSYITGIILRLIILPVRGKFKGAKASRFSQYMQVLKLYFSNKSIVLKTNFALKANNH